MSRSADGATISTRLARGLAAVMVLGVQLAVVVEAIWQAHRVRTLERPAELSVLYGPPNDVRGYLDSHGERSVTLSTERGIELVRVDRATVVSSTSARVDFSALHPGRHLTVWGYPVARFILVWPLLDPRE